MWEINKLPNLEQIELIENEKKINEKLDWMEEKKAMETLINIDKYTNTNVDLAYDKLNKLYTFVDQKNVKILSNHLSFKELQEVWEIVINALKNNNTDISNINPKDIDENSIKINEEAKKILWNLLNINISEWKDWSPISVYEY